MLKKLFFFFALFCLISQAHATLELISNTDHCLTDCKAVLHIAPDISAANISVSSKASNSFRLDFVKPLEKTQILGQSMKLCSNETSNAEYPVFETIQTQVPCLKPDANFAGEAPKICYENKRVFKEFGIKTVTEYVCKDFFGQTIRNDKEYWIEITAKRKAELGNNPVDWQLTFDNVKYSQWAWWNSNWVVKKPIQICPNTDLNVGQLIWVKMINFSALPVLPNLDDVRIVNEFTNTELIRQVEGTSSSIDGNIFFAIDQNILNGRCDSNFVMYYNNVAATTPTYNKANNLEDFERFETGTTSPFDYWAGTGRWDISATTYKSGNKSIRYTAIGESFGYFGNPIPNFDTNLGNRNVDYNFWVYFTDTPNTYVGIAVANWLGYLIFNAGSVTTNNTTAIGSYSAGTWYQVNFNYTWNATTYNVCLFSTTAKIGCATGEASHGAVGSPKIIDIALGTNFVFIDDLKTFQPYQTNVSLGTPEEIGSDTNAPVIKDFNTTISSSAIGWAAATPTIDVNLRCFDTESANLYYLIQNNDVNQSATLSGNNTLIELHIPITKNLNIIKVKCTDTNNNKIEDLNTLVFSLACFSLVDETTGSPFGLANVSGLTGKSLDYNYVYNFKTTATTTRCYYSSSATDTIRFDFNYVNGINLFREIMPSILTDTNINVCAAPIQQFYEIPLISAIQRKVILINNNIGCYSLATTTHYAYGDGSYIPAYTIFAPYYLYTVIGTSRTFLTMIDGTLTKESNLDSLIFNLNKNYSIIGKEYLSFRVSDSTPKLIYIYYKNWEGDSVSTKFEIFDAANRKIFEYAETGTPNDLNFLFNYAAMAIDANLLTITATKTKTDGTTSTITQYFTTTGSASSTNPLIMAAIAMMLLVFSLTLVSKYYSFGWFGIAMCILALGILALAPLAWYIVFLQGITAIVLLFIILLYRAENSAVT